MKLFAVCALIALAAAAPVSDVSEDAPKDIRKSVQDKHAENPMAPFLDIMKEALNPNAEMKTFLDKSMGLLSPHKDGDDKASASGPDLNAMMIKTAMGMAAALSNPPKNADGSSPDPVATMLMALEKSIAPQAEGPNADPLMKLVQTGVKLLISGENGETINPFQLLLDIIAPDGKPLSEDPVVELMTNAVKAAAADKTGDPLNAMVTFVLEDPSTQSNPIVMMAKTMMQLFPQLTQGEEAATEKKA
jgi:hypothetical protein